MQPISHVITERLESDASWCLDSTSQLIQTITTYDLETTIGEKELRFLQDAMLTFNKIKEIAQKIEKENE